MTTGIVVITTCIWAGCVALWWAFGERRLSSPIFLYLVFHLLSFVARPWFILDSHDESFLQSYVGVVLRPADHTWTLWQANLGLLVFVLGGLMGEGLARKRTPPTRWHVVDTRVMAYVGWTMLFLGAVSYWLYAPKPWSASWSGPVAAERVTSQAGYTSISSGTSYWTSFYVTVAGVFVTWICFRGMRRFYVPVLGVYFVAIILIGAGRTTYLVGAIAVALAIMAREGRRWPTKQMTIVLALFLLSFLSGKQWLTDWVGQGRLAAIEGASTSLDKIQSGEGSLFLNYDMLASVVSLVPSDVAYSHFDLYLRPFYFWVPRSLWHSKPVFDYAGAYIAERAPQIDFQGLTVTLVGESYLAFGMFGVVLLMFLWGLLFSYGAYRAFQYPVASVERVFGIALVVTMIQVYRDGIVSLGQYMLYYFGPCLVIWAASEVLGNQRAARGAIEGAQGTEALPAFARPHR